METAIVWILWVLGTVVLMAVAWAVHSRVSRPAASRRGDAEPKRLSDLAPVALPTVTKPTDRTRPLKLQNSLNETRRLRLGDFVELKWLHGSIRLELVDIRQALIPDHYGGGISQPEVAAEIRVELGGAILYSGVQTADRGVNKCLLPRLQNHEESTRCMYAFHSSDTHFSFTRVAIKHINEQDRTADVNVVAVYLSTF